MDGFSISYLLYNFGLHCSRKARSLLGVLILATTNHGNESPIRPRRKCTQYKLVTNVTYAYWHFPSKSSLQIVFDNKLDNIKDLSIEEELSNQNKVDQLQDHNI